MKVINVVGARPNFMKMAPIIDAMNQYPDQIEHLLVHTGQHYDTKMSKAFFDDLGMPKPDIDLGVGSGSHAEQTAKIMVLFEKVCLTEKPDLVIVVGDVNSTMACTITAKKLGIKVAHVEAGLRSRDMEMPEEINRLCTDALCDYLFTTDHFANENLRNEGISEDKIFFVGNVMIDTLLKHKNLALKLDVFNKLGVEKNGYATLTMHRPSNVDSKSVLEEILQTLAEISQIIPIIFPIHPRTRKMIAKYNLSRYLNEGSEVTGIWVTEPMSYLEFLNLNMHASLILTDSGGLQEESTVLGIPCITMRHNTERPITCTIGTNTIVGNSGEKILEASKKALKNNQKNNQIPEKWDGKSAKRIVRWLLKENQFSSDIS